MGKSPKRPVAPKKKAEPSLRDRVQKRYSDDLDEAIPTTLLDKVRYNRKFGEGEYKSVTTGKRQQIFDEKDKRYKRDNELIDTYKKDAPRAKSFMSEQSNPLLKKASGGKVKKMAMGGAMHKMPDGTMMKGKSHGMAEGGKLKMVEKGGKKVPAFAADGVGKMAMGGKVKKMLGGGDILGTISPLAGAVTGKGLFGKMLKAGGAGLGLLGGAAALREDAKKKKSPATAAGMKAGGTMKMRGAGAATRGTKFSKNG